MFVNSKKIQTLLSVDVHGQIRNGAKAAMRGAREPAGTYHSLLVALSDGRPLSAGRGGAATRRQACQAVMGKRTFPAALAVM